MSMEYGWWLKTPEDGKFQVRASVHGGNITWKRKQGHHTPWLPFAADSAAWDKLLFEADTRVQRRLLSPKQFEDLKRLRAKEGF